MKIYLSVISFAIFFVTVSSFGSSDDKFFKKYATMKIYESCFGRQQVKQIQKEMKAAYMKCALFGSPPPAKPPVPQPSPPPSPPDTTTTDPGNSLYPSPGNFDAEKLHQAILAYRPNPYPPQFKPYGNPGASGPAGAGFYPAFANPYQTPMIYPGFPAQYSPFAFPMIGQPFYGNNRVSRDMDFKEMLSSRSDRVKNVTCIMQELGYLDNNLEPNYEKISERIGDLPVSQELRKDMQDGVTFCQQFSQCIPETKKTRSPLYKELMRPMFFFKCYKHKKLEACILKDIRERYSENSDDDDDEDHDIEEDEDDEIVRRQGKSAKLPKPESSVEDLATSMYDFLYGSDGSFDVDGIL